MLHEMRLKPEEFNNIIYNNKTIEVRLNDEKRKKIIEGDKIAFYKFPQNDECILVIVKKTYKFLSFKELYSTFPSSYFGYRHLDLDKMLSKIYSIYSIEQENEDGVVAIEFQVQSINTFPK